MRRQRRFRSVGGYDFPADPTIAADKATLFWTPIAYPDVFQLKIDKQYDNLGVAANHAAMPINLTELSGVKFLCDNDGRSHGLWRVENTQHAFWLESSPFDQHLSYRALLQLDQFFERRVEALLRFWRSLHGRSPSPHFYRLPDQTRHRHILTLRALDGRLMGASYRQIAAELLGFRGTKADWENDPRKNRTRRLVADGNFYMLGGYLKLLHYPVRLPSYR